MNDFFRDNKLKSLSLGLGIILAMLTLIGYVPNPFKVSAERVIEERTPYIYEEVDKRIGIHELMIEPRLQNIESEVKHNKEQMIELKVQGEQLMKIQREILAEVKKQ
jgi:hypothetical protein